MFILDFRGSVCDIYVFLSISFKGRLKADILNENRAEKFSMTKDQMDMIFDNHSKPIVEDLKKVHYGF